MKKLLMIAALGLVAACEEQPAAYEPTPTYSAPSAPAQTYTPPAQVYTPPQPYACNRSDYPATPQGDADYANCVIQS